MVVLKYSRPFAFCVKQSNLSNVFFIFLFFLFIACLVVFLIFWNSLETICQTLLEETVKISNDLSISKVQTLTKIPLMTKSFRGNDKITWLLIVLSSILIPFEYSITIEQLYLNFIDVNYFSLILEEEP